MGKDVLLQALAEGHPLLTHVLEHFLNRRAQRGQQRQRARLMQLAWDLQADVILIAVEIRRRR